ncbi:MAG: CSS-motif domain-containing protein, partial [Gammaproteobacteria bacterium]
MRRNVTILLSVLAAFVAGLAPVAFAIWTAYNSTISKAEENLRSIAAGIAADTSSLLTDIDQGLVALAGLSYECKPEDVKTMNTMAYDIPEISDIGLINPQRKLVCTSWGRIDPPIKPELPP